MGQGLVGGQLHSSLVDDVARGVVDVPAATVLDRLVDVTGDRDARIH